MTPNRGITTTMLPSNGTDIVVNEEMKVETVIVILWISGGILLVALLLLLGCILRTNKKGRRRPNLRPGVFRVLENSNGGVNPSYSNYDEIWTWIPVVRGNEDSCPARQETSRNVTISPATSLASHLEPPPYSVAISTPTIPYGAPRRSTITTAVTSSSAMYGNTVSSISTITSNSNTGGGNIIARSSVPNVNNSNREARDLGFRNSPIVSRVAHTTTTHVLTSTPIQSPRVSRTQHASREVPLHRNAEPIRCVSNGQRPGQEYRQRPTTVYHQGRDVRSPLPNRRSYTEGQTTCSPSTNEPQRQRNTRNEINLSPSFTFDPEEGLYSYLSDNQGRRIWCDIPPTLMDEDGPPPYTRQRDIASREYYQRRPRTERPAPIVRLESDYF